MRDPRLTDAELAARVQLAWRAFTDALLYAHRGLPYESDDERERAARAIGDVLNEYRKRGL